MLLSFLRFPLRKLPNPPFTFFHHHSLSSSSSSLNLLCYDNYSPQNPKPQNLPPPPRPRPPLMRSFQHPRYRLMEKEFAKWTHKLRPGFTAGAVDAVLRSITNPDLAYDIFRWTAQRPSYTHTHLTYLTIIEITASNDRFKYVKALVREVVAGACNANVRFFNSVLHVCSKRVHLMFCAFNVYNKMFKSDNCKPTLESYKLVMGAILKRFHPKDRANFVYLRSIRSLAKQMKASGVIPDTYVMNMFIRAFAECGKIDEAFRIFCDIGLYGRWPNANSYGFIVQGLCRERMVSEGLDLFKEMRSKRLVPHCTVYMILICSLSMDRRFEEAVEIVFDMLDNHRAADLLTYKTLLKGLREEGRGKDAFDLLQKIKKSDRLIDEETCQTLVNEIHFVSQIW